MSGSRLAIPIMLTRIIRHLKSEYYQFLRLFTEPVVTDEFGIKTRMRSFDTTTMKKTLTRENFKEEFARYDQYAHGVVVDAGANVGITAVYLARHADKVYAFEPVPQTFKALQETIALNKSTNIEPVNSALGETKGELEMQIFPEDKSGWNSAYVPRTDESAPVNTTKVPMITLDDFGLERIGFMKIDVEGYELPLLKGADRMLREHRIDGLSFEVTPFHTDDASPIFEYLEQHGYKTTEPYRKVDYDINYFAFPVK